MSDKIGRPIHSLSLSFKFIIYSLIYFLINDGSVFKVQNREQNLTCAKKYVGDLWEIYLSIYNWTIRHMILGHCARKWQYGFMCIRASVLACMRVCAWWLVINESTRNETGALNWLVVCDGTIAGEIFYHK